MIDLRLDNTADLTGVDADLLVIPVVADADPSPAIQAVAEACGKDLLTMAREEGFKAKPKQTFLMRGVDGLKTPRVLLVGVGDHAAITRNGMRRAMAQAARTAHEIRSARVAFTAHDGTVEALRHGVEGFLLGAYRFDRYIRREEDDFEGVQSLTVLANGEAEAELERARIVAEAVCRARDLVNEAPNVLTPEAMAQAARGIASQVGLEATILEEDELLSGGFNLLSAVGRGSDHPPRLIHLVYRPKGEVKQRIAFVGKGITFDTGGYNLKPGSSMLAMHGDMGGGAAVLGAAQAIGALAPSGVEVHFVVPTAENSIDGGAFKPNDIIRGYGGKTVEIHNTDAEGRLILADALAYIQEKGVDTIIDLATLTGACVVALGEYTSGLFTNSDPLADELLAAAEHTGEDFWRMPLTESLDKLLDTPMADMKNIGSRWGGAITAALFLKRWVDTDSWAHLDIAGPAYAESDGELSPQGGTGFGVPTLVEYTLRLSREVGS